MKSVLHHRQDDEVRIQGEQKRRNEQSVEINEREFGVK
jgi:hypothetical protein